MSSLRTFLTATTGALIACAVGAPALAGDVSSAGAGYTAADAPLGAPTELRIDLRGHVQARCEVVTAPQPFEGLVLRNPGRAESGFAIDCNAPFLMRVRSQGGGFLNPAPTPGIEPRLPYEIAVELNTDQGRQDLGWCDSRALGQALSGACPYAASAPGGGWSSGDAVAIDQTGRLSVRWRQNESERPLLGAYDDVIVIELEVRS